MNIYVVCVFFLVNEKKVIGSITKNVSFKELTLTEPAKLKKKVSGLYAHEIWKRLRDDSKSKIKYFDLNKELQVNNFLSS
jgi:hypothetical protein